MDQAAVFKMDIHMLWCMSMLQVESNSSPPVQNGRHFEDDIYICIFENENMYIFIDISLKIVPRGPLDNNPALF